MLFHIVRRSFVNQKKAVMLMVVSVAVGTAIAASLLSLSFDISSKISKELRSYGANIVIEPKRAGLAGLSGQKRFLREEDVFKAKTIFWRHNIVGIAPVLVARVNGFDEGLLGTWYRKTIAVPGENTGFETGVQSVMPWWEIDGVWPAKDDEILAGAVVARRLNKSAADAVKINGKEFRITGIVRTGGKEDELFIGELETIQRLTGLEGKISRVSVSAITTPMDEFAYKDPATMTKAEYEKWYCTGYVTSIAKQLGEVFAGSVAKPFWPVAQTEGIVLTRLNLLVYLLTAVALLSSALAVSATMIVSVVRRTEEVALMKALGAGPSGTAIIFLTEAVIIGAAAGCFGYLLSFGISGYLGYAVFGTVLHQKAVLLPVSIGVAVLISLLGAYLPVRRALAIKPAVVLKGGQ